MVAEPVVKDVLLVEADRCLILASDGVWDTCVQNTAGWPASQSMPVYWSRQAEAQATLRSVWRWWGVLEGASAKASGRAFPLQVGHG